MADNEFIEVNALMRALDGDEDAVDLELDKLSGQEAWSFQHAVTILHRALTAKCDRERITPEQETDRG